MISLLYNVTVTHDQDDIRILDRGQAVCDHKTGSFLSQLIHRPLGQKLRSRIDA